MFKIEGGAATKAVKNCHSGSNSRGDGETCEAAEGRGDVLGGKHDKVLLLNSPM